MRTDSIGKHNPKLTGIRKAIRGGTLTADGLLPLEGRKLIEEAAHSGLDVVDVFVREDQSTDGIPGQRVHVVDLATFKSIQSTETSQGFIALVRLKTFSLDNIAQRPQGLVVILARLQDPGNVGTIVRVAESFGASGCIGLEGTVSPYNPKAVRASAGSLLRLPHVWNVTGAEAFSRLKASGIRIVGTAPAAVKTPESWDWRIPSALVIGNEGGGLNAEELGACDGVVGIRQNPRVESLNSAIATAVILYEAFKQRGPS